jgi:hypothetical protein
MNGDRYGLPVSLEGDVRRELERLDPGSAGTAALADLVAAWPSAVGPGIAANAWPARRSRDGTLVVHVSSSAWAQELTQLEASIRERLGKLASGRLRFVVGPLPESGHESVTSAQDLAPLPTPEDRDRACGMAGEIENPALRAAVSRAAALSLARLRAPGPDRRV